MNEKMASIANEIGRCIYQYYNSDYLEVLFGCGISIEDVIFQILIECSRYAYLINVEKHSLKYYIEKDGLELEPARKRLKRIIDYINTYKIIENRMYSDNINIELLNSYTKPIKKEKNHYPSYELSDFQYWELKNIYTMDLVKAIIEKRIGSSKKIPEKRFIKMADQYDCVINDFRDEYNKLSDRIVFSSLAMFTLEGRYAFDFFYQIACEMETRGKKEIPDMKNRLMAVSGIYKSCSPLPNIDPQFADDNDRIITYPMILQRRRFIKEIVNSNEGDTVDLSLAACIEANVLANAVQSHISFNGMPMRKWFQENTSYDDWVSVFETYDIFRTFVPNKKWSRFKIQSIRKMYDMVSFDYKKEFRKSSIEG